MEKTRNHAVTAQPRLHQTAPEIQAYGSVSHSLPLELEEPVRLEITERLKNQLLADTITIRDLYKKSHWQVAGPRGREEVPVQLSRLLDAHRIIIRDCRAFASRASRLGDDGTNDLIVSQVLRNNELQTWFVSEHLVNIPLVKAESDGRKPRTLA
jgi:starvation-inducible DNA-binding protein